MSHYIRPEKTPATPERFYSSFRRAAPALPSESLLVLVAHVCLESDDGRAIRAWNVGGAKAKPGGAYSWTFFSTSEVENGLRVRYQAPPEDRQPLITATNATYAERVTCFRAFDSLDDATFKKMNDVDFPVAEVLEGIEAARAVGLGPVKVNMVVKRGTNEHEIIPMARHFRGTGVVLRFIEYMDVGATNGWRMDEVLPSAQVIEHLQTEWPLVALQHSAPGETAERWGYADAQGQYDPALGEVGVISSVTQAFCGDCNRARLSTEGRLYLCLFASQGYDLRQLLRDKQSSDTEIAGVIDAIWQGRGDRYSQLRSAMPPDTGNAPVRRVEMSYIGG